ncbi:MULTISPECIES: error-prone DNA polymerase [unclassified Ensifer]|uniref:error-prone DNA polymerase n=1 Tax=unclassified Ensifer TaxID=2633371 RepID=UPI000714A48B|nr:MULTISPECIES: error-prone DNA polymerase [unclassified Ensifer]KQX44198.1 DNA polymerase [Ensifer sp. Root1298]KQX73312.1 DNA polymerase [Ensifer sp. Root1312]KRC16205.1 DNA polymerase [Ensifer sp. Root74]KRD70120.1 DNA polymerase [Ensifer sp. Root954]
MSDATPYFEIGAWSNFSFLEGASHPGEMVVAASRLGIGGLGIADRNTVAGVVRAHAQAKVEKSAFQPGARLTFAEDLPDVLAYPLNRRGWGNLCRMLSAGNLRAKKGTCTLYETDLMEWGEDLLLAVLPGPVIGAPEATLLADFLKRLKPHFADRLYLALVPRYDGFDQFAFAGLATIARHASVRLVATNSPLFHAAGRRPLADVVTAIREHVTIATAGYRLHANAERHLKTPAEMVRIFRDYPEAIANTGHFFGRLKFSLSDLEYQYPDESIPGETPTQTLRRLTMEGARERYPEGISEQVSRQIEYELGLIAEKRYEPYFLTVRNIMQFARGADILCQGRGSAANSTVCYCLGITEVNPLKTTLLFDRFLSTERDEPPDIDVDFEHEKREEVIQHIYRTYGKEHAGLTAAVISYRARSAGRETAKAFGFSEDVQSALAGSVWGWSVADLSEREAQAAGLDTKDPTTVKVLDYATELMSFPRHLSQHVGGFVMTRDRLDEVVPIMNTAMPDRYMIEWDKDDLDTLKILKIDVLALGMLTCIARAFKLLDRHYNEQKTLHQLFKDDQKDVYDMICRADTIGVFQIESRAQMSMLPRLKPRIFYDLVIEVAIVRPGPIQGNMVHPYLKRREQRDKKIPIEYPSPELEAVLKRTLGVPLFQEQAMQIAITAAGFSPGEADQLRRAMATFKRTGTIHTFHEKMIEGMVRNDYPRDFAERCFKQIEGFGEYGFPESHAASFALLVYVSSWLKTYYPDVFCAALLNSQPMGFYAPGQLVRDAREHGVRVLPVDINHSVWDADLEDGGLDRNAIEPRHREMEDVIRTTKAMRLGFNSIKGLNQRELEDKLVANRGAGYGSVRDLWLRSGLSRSALERLADADAFRSIGFDRRKALWAVKALDEKSAAERLPLFEGAAREELRPEPAMILPEMLAGEQVINDYRYLSFSLKAHPVSFLRDTLAAQGIVQSRMLATAPVGRRVTVAGLVLVRQRPGSAKGVIFMTIEDETGVANAIVWPKVFATYRPVVMGARLVKIRGRLQRESSVIHVVAEHIEDITPMLGLLRKEARRFGASERADEALRPTGDARMKRAQGDQRLPIPRHSCSSSSNPDRATAEVADVMPKGRNFH